MPRFALALNVYKFPDIGMISSNIGLKAVMPSFKGVFDSKNALGSSFVHTVEYRYN